LLIGELLTQGLLVKNTNKGGDFPFVYVCDKFCLDQQGRKNSKTQAL